MRVPHFITAPSTGLELCYVRAGRRLIDRGLPLVLVHGFMSSHQSFGPLLRQLGRHRRVYALDLPGFGRSQGPAPSTGKPYDRELFAQAVLDFADALGLGRFVLVGHSMGGGVAQEVAARAPQRIEQLILVNSVGVEVPTCAKLAALPLVGPLLFALFFAVVGLFGRLYSTPLACARSVAQATLRGTLRCLHRARTSLAELQVPTVLLWGEQDSLLTKTSAYRLADLIPNATVRLLPQVGHFTPTDAPLRLCRAVLDALPR